MPIFIVARAMPMVRMGDLKSWMSLENHDGPDLWPLMLEKLNAVVAARGGRPITENGSLVSKDRTGTTNGATVSSYSTNSLKNFRSG
jgi:hypothetical protein